MRRYLLSCDLRAAERTDTDVVIVGCGAAGLYTALNLDPRLSCVLLNKAGPEQSNSMYAQGGIATVILPNALDDPGQHFADTITAGAGLCDEKAVRVLVDEAWSNIRQLIELGVPFDRRDGKLLLTREGGHGKNRILHCGGDATGMHLTRRLYEMTKTRSNIRILDRMFLADILTGENGAAGVLALDEKDRPHYFAASGVVIASGGIGRVYRNSTNAVCATGDGIAAACRAGAELRDMEFVQFHPTSFIHPDESGRFFLISEAMRGEGAVLRNRRGEAFMQGVHPLADLAPRDIVSRAIIMEMKKSDIPNVYLDITARPRSFLKERFPTIYGECMRRGVDIAKDWIPVLPVQHYFMGGIRTDLFGRTSLSGLYAVGESACTGVQGANRLASNSLLECLVFGRRCAREIGGASRLAPKPERPEIGPYREDSGVDLDCSSSEIRTLMTNACGIIRVGKDMMEAQARIGALGARLGEMKLDGAAGMEAYNRSIVALKILRAAIRRKKSVGAHYRADESVEENKDAV